MGYLNQIITSIRNSLFSSLNMGMFEYSNLEAPASYSIGDGINDTFVNKDMSYSTFYNIEGSLATMGNSSILDACQEIKNRLQGSLKSKGVRIQFVFEVDPEKSDMTLKKSTDPILKSIKNKGIGGISIHRSRSEALQDRVSLESCTMVITTLPVYRENILSEMNENSLNRAKKLGTNRKPAAYGQSPFYEFTELFDSHSALCLSVEKCFESIGILITRYTCDDALINTKQLIEGHQAHNGWRPSLLTGKYKPRLYTDGVYSSDQSHTFPSEIGYQLFNKGAVISEGVSNGVIYGDRIYSPLMIDLPSLSPETFDKLFSDIDKEIPVRFSLIIETGHDSIVKKLNNKRTLASFLAITNSANKDIGSGAEEFLSAAKQNHTLVSCKIALCTWGDNDKLVNSRKSNLMQSIQGWGSADAVEEHGDPIELFVNTLPGVSKNFIAPPFPHTLEESFFIAPISRPASPWHTGSSLYRTEDRKLFPVEPLSSQQLSWLDIYFAPPGSGKSLKMAADNMSYLLDSKSGVLPKLGIIDIGPNAGMFVDFSKSQMPTEMQNQFVSLKLVMTPTESTDINPFDTILGCRRPLYIDREALVNYLIICYTPAGETKPYSRLPELLGALIDEMYDYFSDKRNPRPFQIGTDELIDEALTKHEFTLTNTSTWWNVVDFLFEKNDVALAKKAQTHAMPTMNDISSVITDSTNIRDVYGKVQVDGSSELLIDYIKQMTMSIVSDFPILSRPTSVDLESARVIAIDLSNVVSSGSAQADKKTAIMFMIARHLICKDFFQDVKTTIPQIEDMYREYHKERIKAESSAPKKVCYDEFHVPAAVSGFVAQTKRDARLCRKYWASIGIASQKIDHIDQELVDLSDNIFLLSRGKTSSEEKRIVDLFNINEDTLNKMRKLLVGPSREGSSFLYIGNLKGSSARIEQVLYLTLHPFELWGYTTVWLDFLLRKTLVERVGFKKAMGILMKKFPSGTASEYYKVVSENMTSEERKNIHEIVCLELIDKYIK